MPHAFGQRGGTRKLFSKGFGQKGRLPLSRIMTNFKVGDYVDIKIDSAFHKGMPHKFYQGKTGHVFNVTAHALGVQINKQVRGRIIHKRLNIRIEHLRKSQCREAFKERVRKNDAAKVQAKKEGKKISCKRIPVPPREAHVAKGPIAFMNPLKFREMY
jgi:large subunit ribosomal protein L21e